MGDRKNSRNFPDAKPRNKPVLTPRQVEAVNLLIEGWKVKEIAHQFGVRSTCVSEIIHDALYRTGTRTREQLAAWWALRREGLRMNVKGIAA